ARNRKITIIFNPVAGSRRDALLHDVVTALDKRGWQVSVIGTTGPGNATQVAADAAANSADAIVAAGGDGTINEVISGVVGADIPVGIIPMGTANVLALELGLPRRAEAIADIISNGSSRRLHLARVDGQRFMLMVGAGFDGEVVHAISSGMKRRWGKYAFVIRGLQAILANPAQSLTVHADGAQHPAAWAVVTNIAHYGGPYVLLPNADPGEAVLTAILFRKAGRPAMCANLLRIGLGIAATATDVKVLHATSLEISGPPGATVPVQVDGDAAGTLPVRIAATDQLVQVLAPASDA
ncbi:unnamed protein product, partial [Discosporangium mesarthrocarpum]